MKLRKGSLPALERNCVSALTDAAGLGSAGGAARSIDYNILRNI